MMVCLRGVRSRRWIVLLAATVSQLVVPVQATAAVPPITALAFTPDKTALVVGSQAGVDVRSWPALKRVATLPTELANIHDLSFSQDGSILAVAGGHPAVEGTVELYRWPTKELIHRLSPHDDVVYAVAWLSDNKQLALASGDGRVGIVNVANGSTESPARYLDGHSRPVLAVALLPNDGGLLSGGVDQSIRVWDVATGTTRRTLTNHTRAVNDLKVRPNTDSQALPMVASAGDDRTVRFWQPTIGRLVRFVRLDSPASAMTWTADGQLLWAACRDGRVRAIDPDTSAVTKQLPAIDGVAYALVTAPDECILVAGSNGQLRRQPLTPRHASAVPQDAAATSSGSPSENALKLRVRTER
jgi:WD40 repeat protein